MQYRFDVRRCIRDVEDVEGDVSDDYSRHGFGVVEERDDGGEYGEFLRLWVVKKLQHRRVEFERN